MATQYDGIDDFPTSLELPDDNDDLDAASLNVPVEALADRTVNLKTTIDSFARRGGAILVRHVANADALKTVVANNDLEVAIVEDEGALYVYHESLTGIGDEAGWSVVSSVSGQGTWLNIVRSSRGTTEGKLVALDSSGRIPAARIQNAVVYAARQTKSAFNVNYGAPVDMFDGYALVLEQNDIVDITVNAYCSIISSDVEANGRIRPTLSGHTAIAATTIFNMGQIAGVNATDQAVSVTGRFIVTTPGSHNVNALAVLTHGSGGDYIAFDGAQLSVTVYRP